MRLLLTSALVLAVGCVGSVGDIDDGDGNGGGDGGGNGQGQGAKALFKADVHPAIAKCSGGACHDTTAVSGAIAKFYNTDSSASYDAVVVAPTLVGSFSAIAPIITHIQAGHKGIAYAAGEEAKITAWLAAEADARGGQTPTPAVDPEALLREWSGCMSLDNFVAAAMPTAWGNLAADNQQKCQNCHQAGLGILINSNPDTFFNATATKLPFMLKFFSVDTQAAKVVINTGSFMSANQIDGHPLFNATTNAGMTALEKFYDLTMARKTAGTCDPSRIIE